MKVTVKKQIEEQIEITLPCYKIFVHGGIFIKIISEEMALSISESINQYSGVDYFLTSEEYLDSNEKEFNDAYDVVLTKLNDLKNK